MKNKRFWILLGGIVLISAAFLLLNFRVAASNNQINTVVMTTKMEGNYPDPQNDKISIALVGEGPLVGALQEALTEKMNKAGMGQIELVQERKPAYPNPILVVKVGRPGLIWTPFFAMSQFSIHAGFTSYGDATYVDAVEKTKTSVGKPANLYAEYEGKDLSWGLISRPGYHQYLADYFAQQIVEALKNLYNM